MHAHRARTQLGGAAAVRVCREHAERPPPGHVEHLKGHSCPGRRGAVLICHAHRKTPRVRVALRYVDEHGAAGASHYVLGRAAKVREEPRCHHGRAPRGGREPATVERLLGLAGAEVVPGAVRVRLDPGVVVVAVRPPGHVELARRDAHRAQGAHEQR